MLWSAIGVNGAVLSVTTPSGLVIPCKLLFSCEPLSRMQLVGLYYPCCSNAILCVLCFLGGKWVADLTLLSFVQVEEKLLQDAVHNGEAHIRVAATRHSEQAHGAHRMVRCGKGPQRSSVVFGSSSEWHMRDFVARRDPDFLSYVVNNKVCPSLNQNKHSDPLLNAIYIRVK